MNVFAATSRCCCTMCGTTAASAGAANWVTLPSPRGTAEDAGRDRRGRVEHREDEQGVGERVRRAVAAESHQPETTEGVVVEQLRPLGEEEAVAAGRGQLRHQPLCVRPVD